MHRSFISILLLSHSLTLDGFARHKVQRQAGKMQRLTFVSSAVAAALIAPFGASASPFRATRRDAATIPGYGFTGCYTEASNGRALTGSAFFDDQMTAEKCATACAGFKYFGLEYGRECYCGNTLNTGSQETALSECSFPCPGNSAQECGAGGRLSLYTRSDDVVVPTLPTTYRTLGCHSEATNGRALNAKTFGANDMTVEKCADICHADGYPLFGVEYYTECYCGRGLAPGSAPVAESECSFPCAGNPSQTCGGDWRINVYEFSADTSAPTTTAPSTPAPTSSLHSWFSEGCYTEAQGKRALSEVAFYDDAMTLEKCATACSSYSYFGVEYGRECYCGNDLNEGSVEAPASECSFPCPGKPTETCGAGNRLNLYSKEGDSSDDEDDHVPTATVTSVPVTTSEAETSTTTSAPETSTTSAAPEPTTETTSEPSTTTSEAPSTTTSEPAPTITQLISNGDFEGAASAWTIKRPATSIYSYDFANTEAVKSGQHSLAFKVARGGNLIGFYPTITQPFAIKPGGRYTFSASFKPSYAQSFYCRVEFYVTDHAAYDLYGVLANQIASSAEWTTVTGTWTNSNGVAAAALFVRSYCLYPETYNENAGFAIYIDDISLVEQN